MKSYVGVNDLKAGVILWMRDHDKVIWLPIEELIKMREKGLKSFNIKMLDTDEYNLMVLPSTKKVVYLDTDYSPLFKGTSN